MKRYDIAIAGGGAAGLAAAVTAAENGASVAVFEKNGVTGGNGLFPMGIFGVESFIQRRMAVEARAEDWFRYAMRYAHWRIDPRIMRVLMDKSGETIRWLADKGVEFADAMHHLPNLTEVFHVTPVGTPNTGKQAMGALHRAAVELGVDIFLRTEVMAITMKNGCASGLVAKSADGEVTAESGSVIIATGGFAGDYDRIRRYIPSFDENEMLHLIGIRQKGDGLRMAEECGTAVDEKITLEMGAPKYGGPPSINLLLSKPEVVWVNGRGERFCDEGLVYNFAESANAVWRQPRKACYVLMDAGIKEHLLECGMDPLERRTLPENAYETLEADLIKAADTVRVSDTLEGIATFIGCSPEALEATVAEYNAAVRGGYDPVFAKDRRYMLPLERAPYITVRTGVDMLTTHGGIMINHRFNVLDTAGEPIPGLYAAGVDVSGVDGDSYQLTLSGHAFGFSVNGGRLAGEFAWADCNSGKRG